MTDAGDWVRRAGRGRLPDGTVVTWSIAEGRRGRRWREARVRDGAVISSLLLETDPDRRFAHLEVSTAHGLLTLHPERDGTIHGNDVGADGVRHVVGLPWTPDGIVLLAGSPISLAAAARLLRGSVGPRRPVTAECLEIGLNLVVRRERVRVERLSDRTWRFEGRDVLDVGEEGIPRLTDAEDWPLDA